MQEHLRQLEAQLVLIESALRAAVMEPDELQRARYLRVVDCARAAVRQEFEAVLVEVGARPELRLVVGGE